MLLFFEYVVADQDRYTRSDIFAEIVSPYSRVFWRYLLVNPDFAHEEEATRSVHNQLAPYAELKISNKYIDVEDSRNVIRAYLDRLDSSRPATLVRVCAMIRFVAPLVVPGCEDLVPQMVEQSIQLLWSSLTLDEEDPEVTRYAIQIFLTYFYDIFKVLKPQASGYQPWIQEIIENIVEGDLVDLVLRAMLMSRHFDTTNPGSTELKLFKHTIQVFRELQKLAPDVVFLRFYEHGSFGDWMKYIVHFFNPQAAHPSIQAPELFLIEQICGQTATGVLDVILGSEWKVLRRTLLRYCNNPRCPMLYDATLTCSKCEVAYCKKECLAADWLHAWQSPHRRICASQARQLPNILNRYNQIIEIPKDIPTGVSEAKGEKV